jgi:hypothetical protein
MTTSPLPSPASAPEALRDRPWSVKTGLPFLKWTLDAIAAVAAMSAIATAAMKMRVRHRIWWKSLLAVGSTQMGERRFIETNRRELRQ